MKASLLLLVVTMSGCAQRAAVYSDTQASSGQAGSPSTSLQQSIGSSISVNGQRHRVMASYYSALGQTCAITIIAGQADTLNRFCFDSDQNAFVQLKPLIQE